MNALPPAPPIRLGPAQLLPDPSGALWWPEQATLIVADLHLEKGSSFARRGTLLPPYDTAATLTRLAALAERYRPARIVALGDSFHDRDAAERLDPADQQRLAALVGGCDWIWIAGNHDPAPGPALGGTILAEGSVLAGLTLRHEAEFEPAGPELSGEPGHVESDRMRCIGGGAQGAPGSIRHVWGSSVHPGLRLLSGRPTLCYTAITR